MPQDPRETAALMALLKMRSTSNVGASEQPNDPSLPAGTVVPVGPAAQPPSYGFPQGRPQETGVVAPSWAGQRNMARSSSLARMLGLPDNGSISQQDMEDEYANQVAAHNAASQAEAEQKAYPEQIRGQYSVQQEDVKGRYAQKTAETQGQQDRELAHVTGGYAVQAAQAKADNSAALRTQTSAASEQRAVAARQATSDRTGRNQRNANLESRAKLAEKNGPGWFDRLLGTPSGEAQASELRGQQQFGGPAGQAGQAQPAGGGVDAGSIAQQFLAKVPDATPDEIAFALSEEYGVTDSATIQAVIAAAQQLQQGGR